LVSGHWTSPQNEVEVSMPEVDSLGSQRSFAQSSHAPQESNRLVCSLDKKMFAQVPQLICPANKKFSPAQFIG